ncbi:MAG: CCA tRNA nucleotidyltransferase, partial [Dietzia sp.]|nr:CCA tRNA nucleotidyltransferase [Dietzia sp.]
MTARNPHPDPRASSDRHDAAVFSGLQDGPGTPPDPTDSEERRVRLLAGAQTTLNDHADVLAPLASAFAEA